MGCSQCAHCCVSARPAPTLLYAIPAIYRPQPSSMAQPSTATARSMACPQVDRLGCSVLNYILYSSKCEFLDFVDLYFNYSCFQTFPPLCFRDQIQPMGCMFDKPALAHTTICMDTSLLSPPSYLSFYDLQCNPKESYSSP